MFKYTANPKWKMFVQGGDPSQNSNVAYKTMDSVGCRLFNIPTRFPD